MMTALMIAEMTIESGSAGQERGYKLAWRAVGKTTKNLNYFIKIISSNESANLRIGLDLWHGPDGTGGILHSSPIAYADPGMPVSYLSGDAGSGVLAEYISVVLKIKDNGRGRAHVGAGPGVRNPQAVLSARMSWSNPLPAVPTSSTSMLSSSSITSTIYEWGVSQATWQMFGVRGDGVFASSDVPDLGHYADGEDPSCTGDLPVDELSMWWGYLSVSASTSRRAGTDPDFEAIPSEFEATAPVQNTCIPVAMRATMDYEIISSYDRELVGEGLNLWYRANPVYTAVSGEEMMVHYKDPFVVELPNGLGWLMLMVRGLLHASDYASSASVVSTGADLTGGRVSTEIVAFYSPNRHFTGDVWGPMLLVHPLEALAGSNRRMWLGVPGGAFHTDASTGEDFLYLYYNILPDHSVDFGDVDPTTDFTARMFGYNEEVGIAVKRISLSSIYFAWLFHELGLYSPNGLTWSYGDALSGDLLGMVRFWVATGAQPEVTPMFDDGDGGYYGDPAGGRWDDGTSAYRLLPGDPAPMVLNCDGEQELVLFFSVLIRDGEIPEYTFPDPDGAGLRLHVDAAFMAGMGIWRGAAIPGGELVDDILNGTTETTFGVDFLVSANEDASRGVPRDMVITTETPNSVAADADPVSLGKGYGIRVYAGREGVLVYVDGDLELDACPSWERAWDVYALFSWLRETPPAAQPTLPGARKSKVPRDSAAKAGAGPTRKNVVGKPLGRAPSRAPKSSGSDAHPDKAVGRAVLTRAGLAAHQVSGWTVEDGPASAGVSPTHQAGSKPCTCC